MTITCMSAETSNAYIELYFEERYGHGVYTVARFTPIGEERLLGYPDKELSYGNIKDACATYRRWLRKYA